MSTRLVSRCCASFLARDSEHWGAKCLPGVWVRVSFIAPPQTHPFMFLARERLGACLFGICQSMCKWAKCPPFSSLKQASLLTLKPCLLLRRESLHTLKPWLKLMASFIAYPWYSARGANCPPCSWGLQNNTGVLARCVWWGNLHCSPWYGKVECLQCSLPKTNFIVLSLALAG